MRCQSSFTDHLRLPTIFGLRWLGLQGAELATAQVGTIRLRLLKIGAQVRVSVRKVWVQMASSYHYQALCGTVFTQLRC